MQLRLVAGAVGCSIFAACSSPPVRSPIAPATNTVVVAVSNAAATVEKVPAGAVYHIWFQLKETGGQSGATISTVLFTLKSGAVALTATHTPATIQRVPAGGSLALGPINVSDNAGASTTIASEITVAVSFTDDSGHGGSAVGTASITPPIVLTTFTVSGVVTDGTSGPSGRMRGVLVKVLDGVNAGLSRATDFEGSYALTGIAAGSFNLSASLEGYQTKTAGLSISADTRVDFVLSRGSDPPAPPGLPAPPPTPLPLVNLVGTWTGTAVDSQGAAIFTWTLSQSGNSVSGAVQTQAVNPLDGSCGSCHRNKSGTFSGTISGTTLTMTMFFAANAAGDPTPLCSQTISGEASSFAIGTLTTGYSGDDTCEGAFLNGSLVMTHSP